jgi:pyruvate dehydrogenase E1 component alpha subunit
MERALARARSGGGATVVEALTYRLSDHTTADDATRYRPAGELEAAWQREPLLRLRRYLQTQGHWDEAQEADLRAACSAQIEAAVTGYTSLPAPVSDDMFTHLFARPPVELAEQQATARRFARSGR